MTGTGLAEPPRMTAPAEQAEELATRLLRTSPANGPASARARAELAEVSHEVSDLIADHLVRAMDDDVLEVCSVYSNHTVPLWFDSSRQKMIAKLTELAEREPVLLSFVTVLRSIQVRRDALEAAGLGRRLVSVLARPWVIGFLMFPVVFAVIGVATTSGTLRIGLVVGIALALGLMLAIDAAVRRCPSCGRWLAGMQIGMRHLGSFTESVMVSSPRGPTSVDRTGHSYANLWHCVHCRHRWER